MTAERSENEVLFVSGDLFIGSRVRGAIEARGCRLEVAGSGTMAIECLSSGNPWRLVIVDLETPGLRIQDMMAARPGSAPPVIAYGPHVHEQRLSAARSANCDRVLTRGRFDATLPQLLAEFLSDAEM